MNAHTTRWYLNHEWLANGVVNVTRVEDTVRMYRKILLA